MTLAQVCDHTLPQLELLAAALARDRAQQTLMTMQTNYAAIAACVSEAGGRNFRLVQERLLAAGEISNLKSEISNAALAANRRAMAAAIRGDAESQI